VAARPNLDAARQAARRMGDEIDDHLRHILG
jgi:hypothetical protein